MTTKKKAPPAKRTAAQKCTLSFQPASIDSLFPVLDALAWLDLPDVKQIAQFAGIDPRTAGKLIKNCLTVGMVQTATDSCYALSLPYPYKGSHEQKQAVVREALVKMPLMTHLRQFMSLGDPMDAALRKAATLVGVEHYDAKAFAPLMKWAAQLNVLEPKLIAEDLVDQAVQAKVNRHEQKGDEIVAFLSHSSKDKPFVRQLAADLAREGITVWLDEQMIRVGDSITDKISQGLAESDYFLIALSENSVQSEWVKRELNQALVTEIEERKVRILPLKLSECEVPPLIKDKKYADFSSHYRTGVTQLLTAMRGDQTND
jgi:hypothetical protein